MTTYKGRPQRLGNVAIIDFPFLAHFLGPNISKLLRPVTPVAWLRIYHVFQPCQMFSYSRNSYGLAGAVMTKDVGMAHYVSNSLRNNNSLISINIRVSPCAQRTKQTSLFVDILAVARFLKFYFMSFNPLSVLLLLHALDTLFLLFYMYMFIVYM